MRHAQLIRRKVEAYGTRPLPAVAAAQGVLGILQQLEDEMGPLAVAIG
jgi:hypothetical protein